MKFQHPSFEFFLNGRTNAQMHGQTDKPKVICSPLFQSWGHNDSDDYSLALGSKNCTIYVAKTKTLIS